MDHCESCHACEGGQNKAELKLDLSENHFAHIGDFAEVEMPSSKLLKASVLVYVLPLVAFLLGLALGYVLFPASQALSAGLAILFLGVVLLFVHLSEKKRAADPSWHPTLVRVIPKDLHDGKARI